MLHQSSGRRNFNMVIDTTPTPSCFVLVSNVFVQIKDQVMAAITLAEKQEATTSFSESAPK